jgi:hypothetical protein
MKKCPDCGRENAEATGACFECGTTLEGPEISKVNPFFQEPTLSPLVGGTFFPKRIGRLSYILRLLLVVPLFYGAFFSLNMVFLVVFVGYFYCCVVMPRLRDLGLPDLTIVLFFIPILNALLLLCLMIGPQAYWQTLRRKRH